MLRRSAIAVATIVVFGVSLNPAAVSAATPGGGHAQGLSWPSFKRHAPWFNHRAHTPYVGYGYLPYGGFVGADMSDYYAPGSYSYFTDPVALFSMLRPLDQAMMPLSTPIGCKHSVETKKVPSEDGGERTITITRC